MVVSLPDAVVDEWAVVVVTEHTIVAVGAVGRTRRSNNAACAAPPVSAAGEIDWQVLRPALAVQRHGALREHVVTQGRLQLVGASCGQNHLPSRYNPRVRATGQQQKTRRQDEDREGSQRHRIDALFQQMREHPCEVDRARREDAGPCTQVRDRAVRGDAHLRLPAGHQHAFAVEPTPRWPHLVQRLLRDLSRRSLCSAAGAHRLHLEVDLCHALAEGCRRILVRRCTRGGSRSLCRRGFDRSPRSFIRVRLLQPAELLVVVIEGSDIAHHLANAGPGGS
mmetsp:Transcript_62245/g.179047  ORF Transcript_62245/g.179047 Transcript_62245/m.179047 type:complete len:280 (-) Transcript_62245:19-858(-)